MVLTFTSNTYQNGNFNFKHSNGESWNNRFSVLNPEEYDHGRKPSHSRVNREWRYSRNKPRAAPFRQNMTKSANEVKIPPEYFSITREHFVIIKSMHHLSCLQEGLPPSLWKKLNMLTESVNPAFKNDYFFCAVDEISLTWRNSVLDALRNHYDGLIAGALDFISSFPMPADLLKLSVELVMKWSRSQLGRKLHDAVLDEALSLIHQNQLLENVPSCSPSDAVPANDHPRVYERLTSTVGTQTETSSVENATLSCAPTSDSLSKITPDETENGAPNDSGFSTPDSDLSAAAPSSSSQRTQPAAPESFLLPSIDGTPKRATEFLNCCKRAIILGDTNLHNFQLEDCSFLGSRKGRLSFYKQWLQPVQDIYEDITDFVVCLSYLDAANKPSTNFAVLRSVLYHARRLFPNARLSVLLFCIPRNAQKTHKTNMQELSDLISTKRPVDCELIPLPEEISSQNGTWNQLSRNLVLENLKAFL